MGFRNKRQRSFDNRNQYDFALDGVNEYITIANETPLDINDYLTVSAWVKKTGTGRGKAISKGTGSSADGGWTWDYAGFTAGQVEFGVNGGSGIYIYVGSAMSTGVWHLVTAVFNKDLSGNARLKLYIDGVAQTGTYTSGGVFTTISNNNFSLVIGASSTGGLPFDGNIGGVSIWNASLTATQILEIYSKGKSKNLKTHSLAANLVAYYTFDNAVWDGTNWQVPEAKSGIENKKSLLLDGTNEYANIDAVKTPLASTTIGTWACWVKPVDVTPAANTSFLCFGDTDANAYLELIQQTVGTIAAEARNTTATQWRTVTTSAIGRDNTWMHVALVQDSLSPIIYINGVAVAQSFTTSTDKTYWFNNISGLDNGRIGASNYNSLGNINYFNGNIDEVRIWSVGLTAAQITALYNLGSPAEAIAPLTDANSIAHFRCGDANSDSATVLQDVKGGYNGTLVNMEVGDLQYSAPLLGTSVNMELSDLVTGVLGGGN